ncbi:MAG: VOC family protein [Pseudomonadota bacterium]
MTRLEHLNVTVSDPDALAGTLCDRFDWKVRWSGAAMGGGRSVHVGNDDAYVALYRPGAPLDDKPAGYETPKAMNHLGLMVDDLDATEARVRAAGFVPRSHANYEPGRRFYFDAPDGIEIEVVSYD